VVLCEDSPGAPPSATAHELFRGFSYIAPMILSDDPAPKPAVRNAQIISSVSICFSLFTSSFCNSAMTQYNEVDTQKLAGGGLS